MGPYKTPGVYIEEISKFPPSVAQVETAIPAFIGYTEKVEINGITYTPDPDTIDTLKAIRIKSLLEFEEHFGGPFDESGSFGTTLRAVGDNWEIDPTGVPEEPGEFYYLYYSMQLYFANGGGPCYIVSIGLFEDASLISSGDLEQGLEVLKKVDEPTILLFPDAAVLDDANNFYSIFTKALAQSAKLGDRVTLVDVFQGSTDFTVPGSTSVIDDSGIGLRSLIGTSNLQYGAAYYPWLETIYNFGYEEAKVVIEIAQGSTDTIFTQTDINGTVSSLPLRDANDPDDTTPDRVLRDDDNHPYSLYHRNNSLYHLVKSAIGEFKVVLPPSPAIAGIYARVDNIRGVWKAPANVSINDVSRPTVKINDDDQANLNVHTTGKSVNAIRSFVGKGVLVWGARTLAGNDNEWRYISVRRFFNMVEESVKKATEPFVFEPNDANTWVKVRAMIENFLLLQWRAGALAGAKPEDAFFVRVGLPETMTALDILEGRMIVEIGMAVVRPAEFIILKFSHKMQES